MLACQDSDATLSGSPLARKYLADIGAGMWIVLRRSDNPVRRQVAKEVSGTFCIECPSVDCLRTSIRRHVDAIYRMSVVVRRWFVANCRLARQIPDRGVESGMRPAVSSRSCEPKKREQYERSGSNSPACHVRNHIRFYKVSNRNTAPIAVAAKASAKGIIRIWIQTSAPGRLPVAVSTEDPENDSALTATWRSRCRTV